MARLFLLCYYEYEQNVSHNRWSYTIISSKEKPVYYRRHSLCQNVSIKSLACRVPPLTNTKSLTALYTNHQCFVQHSNSEQYIRMQ